MKRLVAFVGTLALAIAAVVVATTAPVGAANPVCAASGQPYPELLDFEITSPDEARRGGTITTSVTTSGGVGELVAHATFLFGAPHHSNQNFIPTSGSVASGSDTGTTSGTVPAGVDPGSYEVYVVVLSDEANCQSLYYLVNDELSLQPNPGGGPLSHTVELGTERFNLVDTGPVSNAQAYVNALTWLFLGREANPNEFATAEMNLASQGRIGMAEQMAASYEWAGKVVDDIYIAALDRQAEPGGRTFWSDRLFDGGSTRDIAVSIYGSPEAFTRSGGTSEGFVVALYNRILDRNPDAGGLDHWVTALDSGRLGPPDVVASFWDSIEFRRQRVERVYERVLRRQSDPGGLAFWAERLLVEDDVRLAALLASSDEFYNQAIS